MYKIQNLNLKTDDFSWLYSNENEVLEIDSKYRFPKFNLDYENACGGNTMYSESVFSTTGKEKWSKLIEDYNFRCFVSEKHGDIVTSYLDHKPHTFLKTSAFSLTIETIKEIISDSKQI